jgi:hypothetical protein
MTPDVFSRSGHFGLRGTQMETDYRARLYARYLRVIAPATPDGFGPREPYLMQVIKPYTLF